MDEKVLSVKDGFNFYLGKFMGELAVSAIIIGVVFIALGLLYLIYYFLDKFNKR